MHHVLSRKKNTVTYAYVSAEVTTVDKTELIIFEVEKNLILYDKLLAVYKDKTKKEYLEGNRSLCQFDELAAQHSLHVILALSLKSIECSTYTL